MAMSEEIKKGSMREVTRSIFTILRQDEELMRLLVYPSENISEGILHPMSDLRDNIVDEDSELYWDLVDKHIFLQEKSSNIEENAMVRLYIYMGRRRGNNKSYIMAKQEVLIDVLMHESFQGGLRMQWINDRLNELLALERVQGSIGYLDHAQGNIWQAPIGYSKYQHIFVAGAGKK